MADLAKYLCSLDASLCANPEARFLLQQFQRDVQVLGRAAAHRRAVKLLESLGADLGEAFKRPLVRAVEAGAK
ncbi:MAG: hypothetical protein WDO74_22325 [Pseudomonadota bacterium]